MFFTIESHSLFKRQITVDRWMNESFKELYLCLTPYLRHTDNKALTSGNPLMLRLMKDILSVIPLRMHSNMMF